MPNHAYQGMTLRKTYFFWNIGETLFDIKRNSIFLDQSPKAKEIKANISKWDRVKLKSFCTANETINKTKRKPMEWEKIFANEAANKGLISKLYKQLIQLNHRKKSNQKMDRRLK